jgi:hypothetical protein
LHYVAADSQAVATNSLLHKLHATGKRAREIAEDKKPLPSRCSFCRGLLEGADRWCARCLRVDRGL